jgi:hypothetical protein
LIPSQYSCHIFCINLAESACDGEAQHMVRRLEHTYTRTPYTWLQHLSGTASRHPQAICKTGPCVPTIPCSRQITVLTVFCLYIHPLNPIPKHRRLKLRPTSAHLSLSLKTRKRGMSAARSIAILMYFSSVSATQSGCPITVSMPAFIWCQVHISKSRGANGASIITSKKSIVLERAWGPVYQLLIPAETLCACRL